MPAPIHNLRRALALGRSLRAAIIAAYRSREAVRETGTRYILPKCDTNEEEHYFS